MELERIAVDFLTTKSNDIKLTIAPDRITLKWNRWTEDTKKHFGSMAIKEYEEYMINECKYTIRGKIINDVIKWKAKNTPLYKTQQ